MAQGNDRDHALQSLREDAEALLAIHSPSTEWAISSPEVAATPVTSQSIEEIVHAELDPDESINRPNARSRNLNGVGQHVKRGSSESRKDRKTLLTVQQMKLSQGSQTGLQELRNDIESFKASRNNSLSILINGAHAASVESSHSQVDGVQRSQLPSPAPSRSNDSPDAEASDATSYLPEIRKDGQEPGELEDGGGARIRASSSALEFGSPILVQRNEEQIKPAERSVSAAASSARPFQSGRTQSTPVFRRKVSSGKGAGQGQMPPMRASKETPLPLKLDKLASKGDFRNETDQASPAPDVLPVPPFSIPTFLQLELAPSRPSPLYMYRPSTTDQLFEPTSLKVERLLNFLMLPPQLERVLWFGTIACVDAWLYNFTILPIRFSTAIAKLVRSMVTNCWAEIKFLTDFIPLGLTRMWQRQVGSSEPPTPMPTPTPTPSDGSWASTSGRTPISQQYPFPGDQPRGSQIAPKSNRPKLRRHRRTRSVASTLVSAEKADIMKGCLILCSTLILMRFDASMMYHSIRGQAAIKLYVIYNVLEVFDRLFSAIGQDILECLFSPESLSRHPNGRSKILRPLSLFPIALVYVLIHATALYYQVITLNVAVNSYSNALLTLLMSNQFVEIKSTVFKRIEKENLFQMTCADVVERFQLWLMLMIIASRNIIETSTASASSSTASAPPPASPTLLPFSFTMFPSLSFSQILNPFILVLGTETLVDWLKHAYITKFNNVKPNLYGRFLDVLAKDYYGHAFSDPSMMKRIGLPVIPLTCLAIRAAVQTYHMAVEQLVPASMPSSVILDPTGAQISPTTAAALRHIDSLFLKVIGQPGIVANANTTANSPVWLPSALAARFLPSWVPDVDTVLSVATNLFFLAALFLVLLAAKLVLGMLLLSYARQRYARMKARENESVFQDGRRRGGWGTVEVDEDKRRWIYADDPEKLKKLRERDREIRDREGASIPSDKGTGEAAKDGRDAKDAGASGPKKGQNYETVERYRLGGSKRIW